ncbi:MAG: ABC transporter permease, partial [Lactimicrobium massiliense]
MIRYIGKRLFYGLITLIGITVIDFILMNMAGNPIEILAGSPKVSKEALAIRAAQLGLDKPAWQQYFIWIRQILTGNFG